MAVNINDVYQTVLYIINKEQRGYITPAEFNSLAAQVQDEIFQSYFPDGNQVNRQIQNNTQNDTEFFNIFDNINYKLYPFQKDLTFTYNTANQGWIFLETDTIHKTGDVISTYIGNPTYNSITQVYSKKDYNKITRSKLTAPTKQFPAAFETSTTIGTSTQAPNQFLLKISPLPSSVSINCLLRPSSPNWTFTIGSLGQYIFNEQFATNFQLDNSEKTNLIVNILKYCGIIINNPTVIQIAEQEAQQTSINEKS